MPKSLLFNHSEQKKFQAISNLPPPTVFEKYQKVSLIFEKNFGYAFLTLTNSFEFSRGIKV